MFDNLDFAKLFKWLFGLTIFFAIVAFVGSCRYCELKSKDTKEKVLTNLKEQKFDSVKQLQQVVITNNQKVVSEVAGSKKPVIEYVTIKQVVKIHDTLFIKYTEVRDSAVYIYRYFHDSIFSGLVTNAGVKIDSINLHNTIAITEFTEHGKTFIQFHNTNPLFKNEGASSLIFKPPNVSRLGFGVFGGWDVLNNKPSLGIGITYQILRL